MNKRIKFFISVLLIFAIFVSIFMIPASSYETEVQTSTSDIFLVNLDTDTVVYSKNPYTNWYAGGLAELMTYLIAYETITSPETVTFEVEQSYIDSLPYSDGCLDRFVGQMLTAKDLMAIMLLTSGSDAAYALADLSTNNDRDAFVGLMNDRVGILGLTSTAYVSPGFDSTSAQHTTCRDTYMLYMEIKKNDFYNEVMSAKLYVPAGLDPNEFTVTAEPSILNEDSPYYFRYTNDAKYSYTEETYEVLAMTTTYRGKTYFFCGLLGLHQSEQNVFADARKLTSWAYLHLSDRKMFSDEDVLSEVTVTPDWGAYQVGLHPENAAFKTVPNEYDESQISYQFNIPKTTKTPLYAGQRIGSAKLYYGREEIDDITLSVDSDEGLGMLSDFGRFSGYVFTQLTPNRAVLSTEPLVQTSTEFGSPEAPAATNAAQPTESGTEG